MISESPEKRPIALFDSGFGGLTVMREITRLLPQEDILYLGDTARLPYGTKSPETILRYATENANFLLEKNIKLLIIPCHTACSHALESLQKWAPIPIIGVIQPGFELLMKATRSLSVAILGTTSTIESGIYQNLIRQHSPKIEVHAVACPLFVPLIEEGFFNHDAAELIAHSYLDFLQTKRIDTALLACTHYPLMRPVIQKVLGPHIQLIEPAARCAEQAYDYLSAAHLLNPQKGSPRYEFYATDNPRKFQRFGKIFLGVEIETAAIPNVIQKLEFWQGGSPDFSAGTRDIARGKDRSEDEKYGAKPTPP